VTLVEIYNDTIRDLLRSEDEDKIPHVIKNDPKGQLYVTDLTTMPFDPLDVQAVRRLS